jgi:flagellar basal body P-ring formation protein FlgA
MRSILWLILVWLASTGPAAAAPEPSPAGALTFRANAEAAGEYIFLKDIAELSPEMTQACGQVQVWTAPPPEQVYTLTREFLHHRLTQLGLGGFLGPESLPPAIQVRQTGALLGNDQVAAAFRRHVLARSHWPEKQMRIEVFPLAEPVLIPDQQVALEVLPAKSDRLLGEVTLDMAIMRQGQIYKRLKVAGKVNLERDVVCAVKPLMPQTAIGPDDIRLSRREVTNLGVDEFFVSPDQVNGRIVARALGPQEIVTQRHLSHQPLINRGDEVTVLLDDQGLVITTKGVAREPGYPGRSIRMLNPKSKKEFQAQVMDAKTVRVML